MARFRSHLFTSARVRAAPRYRPSLARLDSHGPGVLLQSGEPAGGAAFVVTRAAALLIASLDKPALINRRRLAGRDIARLVLDGLLEIEANGRFHAGAGAHRILFAAAGPPRGSAIAQLSLDALRHGAALGPVGPAVLARQLYRFNSQPISPAWRTRFPSDSLIPQFLGQFDAPSRRRAHPEPRVHGPWLVSEATRRHPPAATAAQFKLYLSPMPEHSPTAYRELRALLTARRGPFSIKVARDLPNLLRPDRMIAYFAEREDLLDSAKRLRCRLDGMPFHGVPFSTQIGSDGLLSWGADLAPDRALPLDDRDRSWRSWVTSRLAHALTRAIAGNARSPVQFALDRVSLDGVNTTTWEPTIALLEHAAASGERTNADT